MMSDVLIQMEKCIEKCSETLNKMNVPDTLSVCGAAIEKVCYGMDSEEEKLRELERTVKANQEG